jgi:hypothetical protein
MFVVLDMVREQVQKWMVPQNIGGNVHSVTVVVPIKRRKKRETRVNVVGLKLPILVN